jgi:small subunit ribosomal protein S8
MLTRIRNANSAKHDTVDIPASNMKKAIAQILLDEGYIKAFQVVEDDKQGTIPRDPEIRAGQDPDHSGPSQGFQTRLRIYTSCEEMPRVMKVSAPAILSRTKAL